MFFDWLRGLVVDVEKSELFSYVLIVAVVYHHIIMVNIGYKLGKISSRRS